MTFLALRQYRVVRALLAAAVVLLACAVALHHGGPQPMDHGGHGGGSAPMDHGSHHGDVAGAPMCIGLIAAGVAVEGLILLRRSRRLSSRGRRRPTARRALISAVLVGPLAHPAREGPPLHLQLCVIRR